jgi:hypothetical protein
MVTTIGTETDVRDLIRDLIALDRDAMAAYEAAIERLDDEGYNKALWSFRDDHARHTQKLAPFLGGGEVPQGRRLQADAQGPAKS